MTDSSSSPRFSLRSLLLAVTLIACLLGLYIGLWELAPIPLAFATLIIFTFLGTGWDWQRGSRGWTGACLGGVLGANLAVAFHFICGYTLVEGFEDEGLGLVGAVLIFAPYATLIGAFYGLCFWVAAHLGVEIAQRVMARRG